MFGGSIFRESGQNFTTGKSRQIWVNFSQICFNMIKIMKNHGEISEQCKIFIKIFGFLCAQREK